LQALETLSDERSCAPNVPKHKVCKPTKEQRLTTVGVSKPRCRVDPLFSFSVLLQNDVGTSDHLVQSAEEVVESTAAGLQVTENLKLILPGSRDVVAREIPYR